MQIDVDPGFSNPIAGFVPKKTVYIAVSVHPLIPFTIKRNV